LVNIRAGKVHTILLELGRYTLYY